MKLVVSGKKNELEAFVNHFETRPWVKEIKKKEVHSNNGEKHEVSIQFSTSLLCPSLRRKSEITMRTTTGKEIKILLLHTKVIPMTEEITIISGNNYDIFATSSN